MSLTRGGVQPRPQNSASYSNPFVSAPGLSGGAAGETRLAELAGGALAGMSMSPMALPAGLQPLTVAAIAGALL